MGRADPADAFAAHVNGNQAVAGNGAVEVTRRDAAIGRELRAAGEGDAPLRDQQREPRVLRELFVMRGDLTEVLDKTGNLALGPNTQTNDTQAFPLSAATDVAAGSGYGVRCTPDPVFGLVAFQRSLVATKVATLG